MVLAIVRLKSRYKKNLTEVIKPMTDFLFISLTLFFFATALGYVYFLEGI